MSPELALGIAAGIFAALSALFPMYLYFRKKIETAASDKARKDERIKVLESESGSVDKLRTELTELLEAKSKQADTTRRNFRDEILSEVKSAKGCISEVKEIASGLGTRLTVLEKLENERHEQYKQDQKANAEAHKVIHQRITDAKSAKLV